RLKILINSSTPIVVMETVEERRAIDMVRSACGELGMSVFEWSIADGLVRSGTHAPVAQSPVQPEKATAAAAPHRATGLFSGNSEADRLAQAVLAGATPESSGKTAIYNSRDPVQALANMETMTVEAVFILKDFHRHMEDPVVLRRLRDVGQTFSANRRTVILTSPS